MNEPVVSVIICVRDGEQYLRQALDSVADQDVEQLQVIVIDDGSKDNSVSIAGSHPLRPEILSQEPLGQSAAINRGMQAARGTFLAFLDCDDVWPRGRLALMLAALTQDPRIDFVFGVVANTDKDLKPVGVPSPARLSGAMLIRRTSALRVGEFRTDVTHLAIVDWHGRAAALGLRSRELSEVVLLRRIHGDNIGIRERAGMRDDLLRVMRDHIERKRR